MVETYRPPILASIFRGFGWLGFAGTVFLFVVALIALSESKHGLGDVETPAAHLALFLPAVSGLFSSLILFGIGQVIDLIGRTAYHSAEIHDLLERADSQSVSRWRDVQKALDGVVAHSRKIAANTAPPTPAASAGSGRATELPLAGPLTRYYYADLDNQTAGPVNKQQLRSLVDAGTVGSETMVCVEGGTEWKPLAQSVAL